jgi:hypothetical protein
VAVAGRCVFLLTLIDICKHITALFSQALGEGRAGEIDRLYPDCAAPTSEELR